jgi:hypothetical protein
VKDWQDFPDDDELDRADDLLGQADALLRRHRGDTAASPARTPPTTDHGPAGPVHAMPPAAAMQAFDDDDLPILTEVVEDLDLPAEIFQPPAAPFSMAAAASAAAMPSFVRSPALAELTPAREPAAPEPAEPPSEPDVQPAPVGQPTSQWPPEPLAAPEPPVAPVAAVAPATAPPPPPPPSAAAAEQQLAERLVELDTAIAREIDEWAARELPQIIARELDRLGERIQDEALAHLRATLLPGISARVSSLFEERSPDDPPGR